MNQHAKLHRFASIILSIVLLATSLSFSAFAADSGTDQATVYGHTYTYCSSIDNLYTILFGGAKATFSGSVSTGYIGVLGVIYKQNGSLHKKFSWVFNSETVTGSYKTGGFVAGSPGTYYNARSDIAFYNGNGYDYRTCKRTPNITVQSLTSFPVKLLLQKRNQNNEIYGSEPFLNLFGIEPDLISAVGINGRVGYVRSSDLYGDKPSNLEEAMAYMARQRSMYEAGKFDTVPVYDEDGVTVVDTFMISNCGVTLVADHYEDICGNIVTPEEMVEKEAEMIERYLEKNEP